MAARQGDDSEHGFGCDPDANEFEEATGVSAAAVPLTSMREEELETVFALLCAQTGHDFSLYRPGTVNRRIERRMAVHQIARLGGYVHYLQENPVEVEALFRALLIGVTSFFRDPEAFAALETQVIARLVANRQPDFVIRAWVPGCSTGEEAYSIAILIREQLDALELRCKVQVFATDIDPRAIGFARRGVYAADIATDMTPERFARHFTVLDDGHCRIHKRIRDLLIFSEQDVIQDPPFSKLDLISCRNLMIYMSPELQKRLIPLFHYALNPTGALFLGSAESVGELGNLFSTTARKEKLYRRKDAKYGAASPPFAIFRAAAEARDTRPHHPKTRRPSEQALRALPLRELTERALLQDSPVAALIDERGELLYLYGNTGQYLQLASGEVGVNIIKMACEGLRQDLTSALHDAVVGKERVSRPRVRLQANGACALVNLTVRPLPSGGQGSGSGLFLVTFEPVPAAEQPHTEEPGATKKNSSASSTRAVRQQPTMEGLRILELTRELRTKDDRLRATEEEMHSWTEELKSANEELQSTNEELQSSNEELETSKEELQSVNEELTTVNSELQSKVGDLSRVSNDTNNLLAGTGIGTVFVDQQLCIRRFTPAITQFINLIEADIGRLLAHTVSNLVGYDRLVADVQDVLDTLTPRRVEVQTRSSASYLLHIRPYRISENVLDGAVITFTEIAERPSPAQHSLCHLVPM